MNEYEKLIQFMHDKYYSDLSKDAVAKKIMSDPQSFDSSLRLYYENSQYVDRVDYDRYRQAIIAKRGDPFAKSESVPSASSRPESGSEDRQPSPSPLPDMASAEEDKPVEQPKDIPESAPAQRPEQPSSDPYANLSPLVSDDPSQASIPESRPTKEFPSSALPQSKASIDPSVGDIPSRRFSKGELRKLGYDQDGRVLPHRKGLPGEKQMRAEMWVAGAEGMADAPELPDELRGEPAPIPDPGNPSYTKSAKNPAITLFSYETMEGKALSSEGLVRYLNDLAEWYKGEPALYSSEKKFADQLGKASQDAPVLTKAEKDFINQELAKRYAPNRETFDAYLDQMGYDPESDGVGQFLNRVGRSALEGFAKMEDALTRASLRNIYQSPTVDYIEEATGQDFTDLRRNTLRELSRGLDINPSKSEDFFQGKVADAIGSTIPMLASGSAPSAAVLGALQNAESQYQDAIRSGASKDDAFDAFYVGLPVGAAEGLMGSGKNAGMFWKAMGNATKGSGKTAIITATLAAAKEGGEEAVQESMTQVLNNASAQAIYDETRGYFDGLGENAAIGFATGAMLGGLREAAIRAAKGDFTPKGDHLRRLADLIDTKLESIPRSQAQPQQTNQQEDGQQIQGDQQVQPAQEGQSQEPAPEEATSAEPATREPYSISQAISSDAVFERDGEPGLIRQDGQTIVFETSKEIREIGNVDEISESDISDFGISRQRRLEVEVDGEFGVEVRGKKYSNLYSDKMSAVNRDKNGNVVSVTLQGEDGRNRTFRGTYAQEIAYNYTLLNLEQNGTDEEIEALESAIAEAEAIENASREAKTNPRGGATLSPEEQRKLAEETVLNRIEETGNLKSNEEAEAAQEDTSQEGEGQDAPEGEPNENQQEAPQVEGDSQNTKTDGEETQQQQQEGEVLERVQADPGQEALQQGQLSEEGTQEEISQPEIVRARNGTEVAIERDDAGGISRRSRTVRGQEYEIVERNGKWMERKKSGSNRPWKNAPSTVADALTKHRDADSISGISEETDVALDDNYLVADSRGNLSLSPESGRGSLKEALDEDLNEESPFREALVSGLSNRLQQLSSEARELGDSSPRKRRAIEGEINRIDRILEQIESPLQDQQAITSSEDTAEEGAVGPADEPSESSSSAIVEGEQPVRVVSLDGSMIPEKSVKSAEGDLGISKEDLQEFSEEVRQQKANAERARKDGDTDYQPERGPAAERILEKASKNPKAMNNLVVQEARKMRKKGYNAKRKANQERQPIIRAIESEVKSVKSGARSIVDQVSSAFTPEARRSLEGTEGKGGIRAQILGVFESMAAIEETIGKREAIEVFEEALKKDPAISSLYQSVASQIESMESLTSDSAKSLGFSSKSNLAKAIASQIIFNPAYKQSGKFAPSVSDSPTRANTVEHYAQTMARAEERRARISEQRARAKVAARSINQLVDGSGPDDGNASERRMRDKNARAIRDRLWSKMASLLQKAFPKIDLQIPTSDEWVDIANDLGKDPSQVKGFYYDGTIYLNPDLGTEDTLLHEYAHVWLYAWRNSNPAAFDGMARQVVATPYYQNLPDGYEGDNAIYEAMAQMIGDHATQQFKLGNKRPYTNLVDKVMGALYKVVGLDWKGTLDVTRARMDDFLSVATRDLFSSREISTIASFNLAEFSGLESRTKLKNNDAESIEQARQKAEDILRGGLSFPQKVRAFFQDSHLFIYIAQERIKAAKGSLDGLDVYRDMGLINGAVQTRFEEILSKLKGSDMLRSEAGREASRKASILGRLWDEHGINWEELGTYMYAIHARARNQYVRDLTRSRQVKEGKRILRGQGKDPGNMTDDQILKATQKEILAGSGMTDDQADQIIEKIEAEGKLHIYEQFASEVREQIMKPINQRMIEAGLRTEEQQRELDEMFAGTYVPLHVKKESLIGKGVKLVFSGGSRAMKVVKGPGIKGTDSFSYEDRVNPIAGILQDAQRDLMAAERNMVMQKLAKLIRDNPSEKWAVEAAKYMPERNSDGEVITVRKRDMPKDATPFYEDGKLVYIRSNDNDFYNALNGIASLNWLNGSWVVRFLQKFTAFRRAMLTTYNIAFAPANFSRDYLSMMSVIDGVVPGRNNWSRARMTALMPKIMKAVVKSEKGKESSDEGTRYIQGMIHRMQKAGGIISWIDYERATKSMKSYQKDLSRANRKKTALGTMFDYTARKPARAVSNTIYLYNQMIEQSIRVAAFTTAIEAGMSDADAANAALNVTVNFNRKGHAGSVMNSLFLFSNAGIQGTHMLLHNVKKSGKVRATMGTLVASSIAISVFNQMIADLNDDDEYDKITDQERRNQAFFLMPGAKSLYTKIPLGYGMNIPFALGHQIYKLGSGRTDLPSAVMEMASISEATLNPFSDGYGGMVHSMMPDVMLPAYEIQNNIQFPDKPIYKEGFGAMRLRPSQAYFKGVSSSSKAVADWLAGNYEGGPGLDENGEPRVAWTTFPQGVEVNPEIVDYFVSYLIGGAGKVIQNSMDTGGAAANVISFARTGDATLDEIWQKAKEEIDVNKIPIARRFVEDATSIEWRDGSFLRSSLEDAAKKKFNAETLSRIKRVYESQSDRSPWAKGNMSKLVKAQRQRHESDGATEEEREILDEIDLMTRFN